MSGRTVTTGDGATPPPTSQWADTEPLLEAPVLMVVRPEDTPATLAERRRQQEAELAALAAAPVQHVPAAFLLAVEGLFPDLVSPRPTRRRSASR